MNLHAIAETFSAWIDLVARTLLAMVARSRSLRSVRLIEEEGGVFRAEIERGRGAAEPLPDQVRFAHGSVDGVLSPGLAAAIRGSRVEVILQPGRCLARPLELPKRATEFLQGIVRAQIDRLTPWSASEAIFGWTPPTEPAQDRIRVTVVATARALITPYLQALAKLGASSIVVSTIPQPAPADAVPVALLEHDGHRNIGVWHLRHALAAVFVVLAISAGIAVPAGQLVGNALETESQELSRRISDYRSALRRDGSGAPSELRTLERRKHETPSSVIVLEALSQVLPDHTYVTELRIEGDKLQVIGVTRDAPSLIRLIEQSPHFARATFFAPTTRSPTDPAERFHIEARIKPVFRVGT